MADYGPDVFRFVDPLGVERLNLNNPNGWMLARGLDTGLQPRNRTYLTAPTSDGATLVNHSLGVAKMSVPLFLMRSGADHFYYMQLLERELSRSSNTIEFRPRGSQFTYLLDTYPADIPALHQGLAIPSPFVIGQSGAPLQLEIERYPKPRLLNGGKNFYAGTAASFDDQTGHTAQGTNPPTVTYVTSPVLFGTRSLKVELTSAGNGHADSNARLKPSYQHTSGDQVKVYSVWTYQKPSNVLVSVRTNGGTLISDMSLVEDLWNGWQRYAYTHTSSTDLASIYVRKNSGTSATAYFDGIQIESSPMTSWAPSQSSLIGPQV